jgi:hypothetical protein
LKKQEVFYSWKEIAEYLNRDARTCRRWEKELGLPVHRIAGNSPRSSVFSYKNDIDSWLENRRGKTKKRPLGRVSKRRILLGTIALILLIFPLFIILRHIPIAKAPQESKAAKVEIPSVFNRIENSPFMVEKNHVDDKFIQLKLNENNNDPVALCREADYYLSKKCLKSNELALALYIKARKINSTYAPARYGLAQGYLNKLRYKWSINKQWMVLAENIIIDWSDANVEYPQKYRILADISLLRYGLFNENTLEEAKNHCTLGLSRYPDDPILNSLLGEYHYYKFGLSGGAFEFDKAHEFKSRAYWIHPYLYSNLRYAETLLLREKFQEAAQVCFEIMHLDTSASTKFQLAQILYFQEELRASYETIAGIITPLDDRIKSLLLQAMISARLKDHKIAVERLEEVKLITSGKFDLHDHFLWYDSIYSGLEQNKKAYEYLEALIDSTHGKQNRYVIFRLIEMDKNFNKIRKEKRFKLLIQGK